MAHTKLKFLCRELDDNGKPTGNAVFLTRPRVVTKEVPTSIMLMGIIPHMEQVKIKVPPHTVTRPILMPKHPRTGAPLMSYAAAKHFGIEEKHPDHERIQAG